MKLTKLKSVLLVIGFGTLILGAVLFFVTPLLAGSGFEYIALEVFLAGCKTLISFDFANTAYLLLVTFVGVTLICAIVWAIVLAAKKKGKSFIAWFFVVVGVLALELIVACYFVPQVRFNAEEGKLFKMIMECEGQLLGRTLSMVAIALFYLSLMFLTLFAFMGVSTSVLGDLEPARATNFEEEQVDDDYDDRKAREEAFFKQCVDSGEFTVYEEYELDKPLKGYKEEPVFEETQVEEETKVTNRTSYVKVTHSKKQTLVK